MPPIANSLRQEIFAEAAYRCAYCLTSHRLLGMPPVIDHIVPKSDGGSDDRDNLAAACYRCNEFKGTKTHAIDPTTGALTPLYHPNKQKWVGHFAWANGGTHIVGITAVGRATVIALRLNNEYIVEARTLWIQWDWHPPR